MTATKIRKPAKARAKLPPKLGGWHVERRAERLDKTGFCRACQRLGCEPGPYFAAGEIRSSPFGPAFFIWGNGHTRLEAIDEANERLGRERP